MRWLDAARARLRLLRSRRIAESRIDKEFALHLDLEAERLMREKGLAPDVARNRSVAAFGGMDQHKEMLRDGRGLSWLGGFAPRRQTRAAVARQVPGTHLVAIAAMAFGIAAGAGAFELRTQMTNPSSAFRVARVAPILG